MERGEIDLFGYSDYREFLRDFYRKEKARNPNYSFRVFALRAKIASPNYLKLVIDGERRITDKTLPQFIRGLKLAKGEAEYFRNLVLYQEATDVEAKDSHLASMARLRSKHRTEVTRLQQERYEILKSWHHWAIRELVLLKDFRDDGDWISARLGRRITSLQASESLALLERLGFVRKESGRWSLGESLLTTGDDVASLLIRNLHRQFMDLSASSMLNDPLDQREVSGLTVAVPKTKIPEVKNQIREFRRDLNRSLSSSKEANDEVYHLIVNFFPLTRVGDRP
jgi:uncharacterized protein (TIGR02147 family)